MYSHIHCALLLSLAIILTSSIHKIQAIWFHNLDWGFSVHSCEKWSISRGVWMTAVIPEFSEGKYPGSPSNTLVLAGDAGSSPA